MNCLKAVCCCSPCCCPPSGVSASEKWRPPSKSCVSIVYQGSEPVEAEPDLVQGERSALLSADQSVVSRRSSSLRALRSEKDSLRPLTSGSRAEDRDHSGEDSDNSADESSADESLGLSGGFIRLAARSRTCLVEPGKFYATLPLSLNRRYGMYKGYKHYQYHFQQPSPKFYTHPQIGSLPPSHLHAYRPSMLSTSSDARAVKIQPSAAACIPTDSSSSSSSSPSRSSSKLRTARAATLQLSLSYDAERRALTVRLIRASFLQTLQPSPTSTGPATKLRSSTMPRESARRREIAGGVFAVAFVYPSERGEARQAFQTKVVTQSASDPVSVFDSSFLFNGLDLLPAGSSGRDNSSSSSSSPSHSTTTPNSSPTMMKMKRTLILDIYHVDAMTVNKLIGSVNLPLEQARNLYGLNGSVFTVDVVAASNSETEAVSSHKVSELEKQKKQEQAGERGSVLLSLVYQKSSHKLQGIILKAVKLCSTVSKTCDPYVKIELLNGGTAVKQWKSTYKKNTANPIFNESFAFDLSKLDCSQLSVNVTVLNNSPQHQDPLSEEATASTVLGRTCIGALAETKAGKLHWTEVLSSSSQFVSLWHSLTMRKTEGL